MDAQTLLLLLVGGLQLVAVVKTRALGRQIAGIAGAVLANEAAAVQRHTDLVARLGPIPRRVSRPISVPHLRPVDSD